MNLGFLQFRSRMIFQKIGILLIMHFGDNRQRLFFFQLPNLPMKILNDFYSAGADIYEPFNSIPLYLYKNFIIIMIFYKVFELN